MSTFTVVNEAVLLRAVQQCSNRLVYIAPGITEPVVHAMGELMGRQPMPSLTVIVDTDPEVCRLGYGTLEGFKALQALAAAQMLLVRYQAGLRLGVLICDEEIAVYSPTPLLIEAGSSSMDQPNAIQLGAAAPLTQLLRACAADGESGLDFPLPQQAEIGAKPASPELMLATVKDLERLPPKPFDVARTERVYNTLLQYVEFEVTGYKLAARRVQIPTDLLVGTDKTLEARLRNTFSLLEGQESLVVQFPDTEPADGSPILGKDGQPLMVDYSERSIEEERKKIHADFLTSVAGHGQLLPKARRAEFDARVAWFDARVAVFTAAVKEKLAQAVEESVKNLTEALLPAVMKNPPARLKKHVLNVSTTEDDYRAAVRAELGKAFNLGDRFFAPTVKVQFKDLTYETLKDPKFMVSLNKAFPGLTQTPIFEEHDAAPEMRRPSQR